MIKYVFKYSLLFTFLFASNSPSTAVIRTGEGFIDYSNRVIVSRGTAPVVSNEKTRNGFKMIEKNLKIFDEHLKKDLRFGQIAPSRIESCMSWDGFEFIWI